MSMEIDTPEDSLADDLLRGAPAIGRFIDEPALRVYYLAEKQLVPIGRLGNGLIASKRRLREHYEQITRGVVGTTLELDPASSRSPRPRAR